MNENEQDFGTLRQFLKLKRHETPPPGYFNHFSSEVIARIRENNSGEERIFSEAPWLLKFLQLFEFKPAFAGAFASALFLLLAFGFVFADRPETAPQPLLQNAGQPSSSFASATPVALSQSTESSGIVASTNPAASLQPVASIFNSQNPFAQQVSLTVPGN
jgi:hypothetical protein